MSPRIKPGKSVTNHGKHIENERKRKHVLEEPEWSWKMISDLVDDGSEGLLIQCL